MLFICSASANVNANAERQIYITERPELIIAEQFEINSWMAQYQQYEALITVTAQGGRESVENELHKNRHALLDSLGVSSDVLNQFAQALLYYSKGEFSVEYQGNICPGVSELTDDTFSTFELDERLKILLDGGERVLYTMMELRSFQEMLIKEEQSKRWLEVRGETFDEQYRKRICGRIKTLAEALKPLVESPKLFNYEKFSKQIARDINTLIDGEVAVFDQASAPVKQALFDYIAPLILILNDEESNLKEVLLAELEAQELSMENLVIAIAMEITTMAEQKAAHAVFEQYLTLPSLVTDLLERGVTAAQKQAAIDGAEAINATAYKLNKQEELQRDLTQLEKANAGYKAIQRFLAALKTDAPSVQELIPSVPTTELDKLKESITDVEKQTCDALKFERAGADWGGNQWGVMPTEESPFGIRYTANPETDTTYGKHKGSDPYRVTVELLVFVPGSGHRLTLSASEPGCLSNGANGFSAIDLGITAKSVYLDKSKRKSFSKGFYIHNKTPIVESEQLIEALTDLGLLGGWISNSPGAVLSNTFGSLSVELVLNHTALTVDILEEGELVFNPRSVGKAFCKVLEKEILPLKQGELLQKVKLGFGDWSIGLNTKAKATFVLPACSDFYSEKKKGPLVALTSSNVAAEANLLVKGKAGNNRFEWEATAFVEASKNSLSVKGYQLGEAPKEIVEYLESSVASLVRELSLPAVDAAEFQVFVDAAKYIHTLESLEIPISVQVLSNTCAAQALSLVVSVPSLKITLDEKALKNSLETALRCEGERIITEHIVDEIQCEKITLGFVGNSLKIKGSPVEKKVKGVKQCELNFESSISGKTINIDNVFASASANGKLVFDFSNAKDHGTLTPFIEEKVKAVLGGIADKGLKLTNSRFKKNAYMVDVALEHNELGRIDLGSLTVHANGKVALENDLKRIVASKIEAVIKPALEGFARKHLPEEVEIIDVNVALIESGKSKGLTASANLVVKVYDDIRIHTSVTLLPKLNLELDITDISGQVVAELKEKLKDLLSFSNDSMGVELRDIDVTPNYDITLILSVKLDLEALGELTTDSVYVSKNGITLRGRIEVRTDYALPLFATPPVYLTRPGVYYDMGNDSVKGSEEKQKVGALGALTVIAPQMDKLVQIDADLTTDDAENFLSQLILTGQLVLLNSVPVITANGTMDFKKGQVSFSGETTKVLEKIIKANAHGSFNKPGDGMVELSTQLSLFSVDLMRTEFSIYPTQCPGPCIVGAASTDLGIGSGKIEAKIDPLIVQSALAMAFKLKLFGEELGKAEFDASLQRARLEATVFKALTFTATTPSKKQMTPEYLAALIASLLNVDLKDIMKWLKNPKIEVSPAGDPSSGDSSGANKGSADGGSPSDGGANAGGTATSGGDSEGKPQGGKQGAGDDEIKKNKDLFDKTKTKKMTDAPDQRGEQGHSAVACLEVNKNTYRWGFISQSNYYSEPYYWAWWHHTLLSEDDIKDICKKSKTQPPKLSRSVKNAFLIEDDFRPVRTASQFSNKETVHLGECGKNAAHSYYCSEYFPSRQVSYIPPREGEEDHYRSIHADLRQLARVKKTRSNGNKGSKTIKIHDDDFDDFEEFSSWLAMSEDQRKSLGVNKEFNRLYGGVLSHLAKKNIWPGKITKFSKDFVQVFWSEYTKVTITYTKQEAPSKAEGYEKVVVWVSRNAKDVKFVRECNWYERERRHGWRRYIGTSDCSELDDPKVLQDDKNRMAKEALGSQYANVLVEDKFADLNPYYSAWFVDDVIPAIITGEKLPELGVEVPLDSTVAQCQPKRITLTEDTNRLTYKVLVNDNNVQRYINIPVEKEGGHGYWANSKSDHAKHLMGNFLACEANPNVWLAQNRIWFEHESTLEKQPLFFYSPIKGDTRNYRLSSLAGGREARYYTVPKFNPYIQNKKLSNTVKQKIYKEIEPHNNSKIEFYINDYSNIEVTSLQYGEYTEIALRYTPCYKNSGTELKEACGDMEPLVNNDTLNFPDPFTTEQVAECLKQLPGGAKYSIREFIETPNIVESVGAGVRTVFKTLHAAKKLNCTAAF